jgi:hypothetical protein
MIAPGAKVRMRPTACRANGPHLAFVFPARLRLAGEQVRVRKGGSMSRGLALLAVLVAAFLVLMGLLGVFAGVALAFPTTEESFFKLGPLPELKGAVLSLVGFVVLAAGYFLTRLAGKIYR